MSKSVMVCGWETINMMLSLSFLCSKGIPGSGHMSGYHVFLKGICKVPHWSSYRDKHPCSHHFSISQKDCKSSCQCSVASVVELSETGSCGERSHGEKLVAYLLVTVLSHRVSQVWLFCFVLFPSIQRHHLPPSSLVVDSVVWPANNLQEHFHFPGPLSSTQLNI